MTHKFTAAAAILASVSATSLMAGGIERTNQVVGILFEEGTYAEFSFGSVSPDVSGTEAAPLGGDDSGNMAASYLQFGAAYRRDLNDRLSMAVIFDQPFGANVDYPTGTGYQFAGATADLKSNALTGLLRYELESNFSVYGGLRVQTLEATVSIPSIGPGYTAEAKRDVGFGYVVGAAWEKPEIAMRVALTYNSKVEHNWDTYETLGVAAPVSNTKVETPQSVNLDFQTGIAQNTLLFAGVRWVDWSEFDISPAVYVTPPPGGVGEPLVSYDDDTITYTIGLGHRINDNWAVSGRINYEASQGGYASNLGPTDGYLGVVLGAQYTQGNVEISGGISYVDISDAETKIGPFAPGSSFTGNSAIGAGVRVGYRF